MDIDELKELENQRNLLDRKIKAAYKEKEKEMIESVLHYAGRTYKSQSEKYFFKIIKIISYYEVEIVYVDLKENEIMKDKLNLMRRTGIKDKPFIIDIYTEISNEEFERILMAEAVNLSKGEV